MVSVIVPMYKCDEYFSGGAARNYGLSVAKAIYSEGIE